MEGRHGSTKRGQVDGGRYGARTLSFVSCARAAWVKVLELGINPEMSFLEHADMRLGWSCKLEGWLRGRTNDPHVRGNRSRGRHGVDVEGVQTVLEGFRCHELAELTAQDLRVSTKMMHEHLRCLLILREVSALIETTGSGRIHEELRRSVEFDDQTTRSRW